MPSDPRIRASRPRRALRRIGIALLLLAVLPCRATDVPALLDALDAVRERHGAAGFGLAIVEDGRIAYVGGRGLADRATGRTVAPDTLWRVGSITKMFTAVATTIAGREHGFGLDAPLRQIVPDAPFDNPWEATDPLRIAHLLEHTGGLLDLSRREFDSSDPKPLTLAEAFAVDPGSRLLQWPPGRHMSYSNVGAGLASLAIERATGRRYEDFVRERVLAPLGMTSAGFHPVVADPARLARGYDRDGASPIPYWHTLYRAFGGLNATAGDMARMVAWLIAADPRPVLSEAERARLETPGTTLSARSGLRYGYAAGLYHYIHGGIPWMGHGGDADGYLSRLGYVRARGTGYFLVINAFQGDTIDEMQALVEGALSARWPRPPPAPVVALSRGALEAFAGCYATVTRRFLWGEDADDPVLTVTVEGDHLLAVNPLGRERRWHPVNARHFRRDDEPVATIAIVPDPDGRLVIQGDIGNLARQAPGESTRCP